MSTPIIGKSIATVDQCEAFLRTKNPNAPHLANIYKKYCDIYGIRLECIWVQMCLETNFLRYSDTSITTLDMHNYAGLGAIDGNGRRQALSFTTEDEGVKCHVQHLYAYCSNNPLPEEEILIDLRFKYVTRGIAPNIENLGNGNWATSTDYASKLLNLLSELLITTTKTYYTKTYYRVQLSACKVRENASNLVNELKSKGIDSFLVVDGELYKVFCGSYSVKDNATSMVSKLKELGYDSFIVNVTK